MLYRDRAVRQNFRFAILRGYVRNQMFLEQNQNRLISLPRDTSAPKSVLSVERRQTPC